MNMLLPISVQRTNDSMEQHSELYSNIRLPALKIKRYFVNLLFGMIVTSTGYPRSTAASSIDIKIFGGYVYSGLIKLTFQNNSNIIHQGFLCDDEQWTLTTGEVLCKDAGFSGVHLVLHDAESKYGKHSSESYLHGLSCQGDEESLSECTYLSWSEERCPALAGVQCNTDRKSKSSGIYASFFGRIFMSTMFVPICTVFCVLCRCCHRHHNERRRQRRRCLSAAYVHARIREHSPDFPAHMAAADLTDLPSYDQIMADTSNNFKKVDTNRNDDNETEEPPPSYENVIGSWTDQNHLSVT